MKKTFITTVLIWAVFVFGLHVYAQQETGVDTEHGYFRKPGTGDYGASFRSLQHSKMEKADRAIHSANIITWVIEYPNSGDVIGAKRVPGTLVIDEVTAVMYADANENVTINIEHGLDRSGSGALKLWTDSQTITNMSTGQTLTTTFANAQVDTNEYLWITIDGNSGNIEELNLTVDASVS